MIAVALAPFATKATCACISHPEVDINAKIIDSLNPQKIDPPISKTVCDTDLYFKQTADEAVFATTIAKELEQEGYERGRLGLPPLSPEEIRVKTMARFQEEWRAAVKRVTATPKQLRPNKFLSFFRR